MSVPASRGIIGFWRESSASVTRRPFATSLSFIGARLRAGRAGGVLDRDKRILWTDPARSADVLDASEERVRQFLP